jgi:hypothetical protein
MRPIWLFPLLMTLTVTVLVACGGSPSAGTSARTSLSKTVDGIRFSVALDPNSLSSNQNTVVEVSLVDSQGQPLSDARVVVSLNPAAHGMTPVIAAAEPKAKGAYTATLKPTGMTGDHYLNVDLQWQGKAYQARFNNLSVK